MSNLVSIIRQQAQELARETVEFRRHLHQYPELSFNEVKTAEYIASLLKDHDLPCQRNFGGGNGVVARIEGSASPQSSTMTKTIALRADMDALPIQEENDVPYKSRNPGVMHACGHDAHSAILFSAAKILKELRSQFSGIVQFIFQPAEERSPGGAQGMIQHGVLEGVNAILGEHVNPTLPVGTAGFCSGTMMASADEIYLHVQGRGGHAAMPHLLTDPVLIASHIIIALQQIVSRQSKPDDPCVLSFGKVDAPGAMNVIPDTVHIVGTFRALNEDWRNKALESISNMAASIARSMGGTCEVEIIRGYPPLINNEELTRRSREAAITYLGKEQVVDLPLAMWSEDFAYYNQQLPGCFYNLGVGNKGGDPTGLLHTSTLMIDEGALEIGSGLMAWLAICELNGTALNAH